MMDRVLVDTGPLVAVTSRRDAYHEVCVRQSSELPHPLYTCWPVLTEAAWLLRRHPVGFGKLLASIEHRALRLLDLDEAAVPKIAAFLDRYRNLGAQLADAALMYLAEREGIDTIFTLDSRDFTLYRLSRNRKVRVIPKVE